MDLRAGWLAQVTGGRVVAGASDSAIGRVVTDTRQLQAGDFFIALRGPRYDGHQFLDVARERGACGALVDAACGGPFWGATVQVADTLRGLQDLAAAVRRDSGARVIAITGSAGKTTTKETLAALLGARFDVVRNRGNLNNHIGLPLSLLELRTRPDVAVMELGMNHAGEISRLVEIARPDVRIWTNVGDAHLGHFASADAIADAKAEILEGASPDSVLVCNADDARVMSRVSAFAGRTITFGTAPGADLRATEIEDLGADGMRARVHTPAGDALVHTPLLGRGNLSNVLASMAVALDSGVALDDIVARVATMAPADRRGVVHRLRHGIVVIDDSYNSSPSALRAALDVVGRSHALRKVAALGEMLELGDHAEALHAECGRAAAAAGLARLVTVGGAAAEAMAVAAVQAGMPTTAVTFVADSGRAADELAPALAPGDLVLVKGSRGIRMDAVTDRLLAEHA